MYRHLLLLLVGVTAAAPSIDGSCGGSKKYTCLGSKFGNCCSVYGWCGKTTAYCGAGCQMSFGDCGGPSSTLKTTITTRKTTSQSTSTRRITTSTTTSRPTSSTTTTTTRVSSTTPKPSTSAASQTSSFSTTTTYTSSPLSRSTSISVLSSSSSSSIYTGSSTSGLSSTTFITPSSTTKTSLPIQSSSSLLSSSLTTSETLTTIATPTLTGTTTTTVTPLATSTTSCGPSGDNQVCAPGLCCGRFGYCGVGDIYCRAGCQAGFGRCAPSPAGSPTGNDSGSPAAAVTAPGALAFYDASLTAGGPGHATHDAYTCYSGPASNFPPPAQWQSFEALWAFQVDNALRPIGDSESEIQALRTAILAVARTAKVDARVILAVVITESTGNVRVGCTNNGVTNCGLMQSHDPVQQAYDPNDMQNSITMMIRDGTQGTIKGPGLVQYLNDHPSTGYATNGNLWAALRMYNSGSYNPDNLGDGRGATPGYVSGIANYLLGWRGWGATNCP